MHVAGVQLPAWADQVAVELTHHRQRGVEKSAFKAKLKSIGVAREGWGFSELAGILPQAD